MDERKIIAAAARGDRYSFNQLVRAYQGLVYRTAFHLLGDSGAATEVTQATFVAARRELRSLRGLAFKVWLLRYVLAACNTRGVCRAAEPSHELDALLQASLLALPLPERAAIVLADVEGLAYAELAQVMGTNIPAVQVCLSRARVQLRDALFARPGVQATYYDAAARSVPTSQEQRRL